MSESKFTFLDRAIGYFSPGIAMERAVNRYWLNEFSDGRLSFGEQRLRGSSGGRTKHSSSESARKQRDRTDKIWEARDMEEKFCLVRGILDRLEQYVCGEITYQARTGDEVVDKAYQDYFHDWCSRADITRRHRFREMVAMGFRGMVRDGEFGWIKLMEDDELRLQPIEADRIGGPNAIKTDEYNIGGIKINNLGQITEYEIVKRSRLGVYTRDVEVKPEHFIHLFKSLRPDAYHGDSWLAPALPHARDIHELFGFEKQAMKFAAAFAGFIRRKDPFASQGGTSWATRKGGPAGPNMFEAQAGMIRILQEGEEIQFPTSTGRPSGNLMQFVEILIREIALGLNLPYGFVYNMAQLGGVTARIELMQVARSIRRYQKMLEDIVLNNVRDEVLNLGIAFGKIPPHPNWNQGKWSFGPRLTGDSGNYVQELMILMQNGIVSASDVIEELTGSSNEEVLQKIVSDINEAISASAAGRQPVPLEMIAPTRFSGATQFLAAMNTPPEAPPKPNGIIEKQGEKAVSLILDLLEKYADGKIERESAVSALMQLNGLTRARAEKLISSRPPQPRENDRQTKSDEANDE